MEWGALLIPIVLSLLALYFFRHKITFWEVALPIVVSIIIIISMKAIMIASAPKDIEYLSEFPVTATYYEEWNERVSCRHPKYCTRTESYTYPCGKSTCVGTRTVSYQCGYHHPYDVDFHPEGWVMKMNTNRHHPIPRNYYKYLVQLWGNESFRDMNRGFHTIDGDAYYTEWDMKFNTIKPYSYSSPYVNKTQSSKSVFKFRDLDSLEIINVYDYPKIINDRQINCINCDNKDNLYLERYNSLVGYKKQIKIYVILFEDKPYSHSELQKIYWQGGNKNELVICVGDDWTNTFSWCDDKSIEVEINSIFNMDSIPLSDKLKQIDPLIQNNWKRKEFKDFDYIKIYLTGGQLFWIYIITFLVSGGILVWAVLNEFKQ